MFVRYKLYAAILGIAIVFFSGCKEDDSSPVFSESTTGNSAPVITAIEPADFAVGGVTQVKITGSNFISSTDSAGGNFVYFGNKPAAVISASVNEINVMPQNVPDDTVINIKVVTSGQFLPAVSQAYSVKSIFKEIKGIVDDPVRSFIVDKNGDFFIQVYSSNIFKITSAGLKTEYGIIDFNTAADMRFGPDGTLYILRFNNENMYTIPPGGGTAVQFVKFPGKCKSFDMSADNHIYAGGPGGIFSTDLTGSIKAVGDYGSLDIRALRIFNGYIYAGVNGSSGAVGIYRSEILADGSLGQKQLYYDWKNSGDFSSSTINSITFSETGELLVGTTHMASYPGLRDPYDPILIIHQGGTSAETLYKGLLKAPADNIFWGTGVYFYQNLRNESDAILNGIYRVYFGTNGAPYYGNQ